MAPRAVKRCATAHRWAVSATPLKNGVASLTSLLDFVAPDYVRGGDWNALVAAYSSSSSSSSSRVGDLAASTSTPLRRSRSSTVNMRFGCDASG